MNPETILLLINGIMAIVRRHAAEHAGEILTDELVQQRLSAALADGQSQISQWFAAKGLPPPV